MTDDAPRRDVRQLAEIRRRLEWLRARHLPGQTTGHADDASAEDVVWMAEVALAALLDAEALAARGVGLEHTVPCVSCGKPSCTIENCGEAGHGDSCELSALHGWVCSGECWDRIAALTDSPPGGAPASAAAGPQEQAGGSDSGRTVDAGTGMRGVSGTEAQSGPSQSPAASPAPGGAAPLEVRQAVRRIADAVLVLPTGFTRNDAYRAVANAAGAELIALAQPCGAPQPSEAAIEAAHAEYAHVLVDQLDKTGGLGPSYGVIAFRAALYAAYAAQFGAPGGGPQDRTP
jgi:hypothetical protein